MEHFEHQWFWDGFEHVDPAKEANAQAVRLKSHTTSLASEHARQGRDWETELRQIAREKQLMRELGLNDADVATNNPPGAPGTPGDDDDESDADESQPSNRSRSAA